MAPSRPCAATHTRNRSLARVAQNSLRTSKILPVLDPSIRERSKTPEFFQALESWEPSMSQMPLRASEIWVSRCHNVKILEKIALRAPGITTQDQQNSRLQPLALESEHRAKMTYSIPDLVSRNRTKNQEFFQVLESTSPRNQIKTYRDANPEFCNALPVRRL